MFIEIWRSLDFALGKLWRFLKSSPINIEELTKIEKLINIEEELPNIEKLKNIEEELTNNLKWIVQKQ